MLLFAPDMVAVRGFLWVESGGVVDSWCGTGGLGHGAVDMAGVQLSAGRLRREQVYGVC